MHKQKGGAWANHSYNGAADLWERLKSSRAWTGTWLIPKIGWCIAEKIRSELRLDRKYFIVGD